MSFWDMKRKRVLKEATHRYNVLIEEFQESKYPAKQRSLILSCLLNANLVEQGETLNAVKGYVERGIKALEELKKVDHEIALAKRDVGKGVPKHLLEKQSDLKIEASVANHGEIIYGWYADKLEEKRDQLETLILFYTPELAEQFGIYEATLPPSESGKWKVKIPKNAKKVFLK